MKPSRSIALLLVPACALVALFGPTASTQEGNSPFPDMDEMMKRAMESAQPGAEHEWLATLEGNWRSTAKVRMQPQAEPITMRGRMEARMILGGRWLQLREFGSFMGQPYEGLSFFGFDRRHGLFRSVGFDTLGTYYITASGKKRDDGVLVLEGEDQDLMGKQVYRFEWRRPDPDTLEVAIIFTELAGQKFPDGYRMMEMTYERVRDAEETEEG